MQKYFAELLATFTLTFAVSTSIAVASPILAALVVGVFVYTIGSISGAHLNPAVTLAVWVLRKIKGVEAAGYIVAQVLGALAAMVLVSWFAFGYLKALPTIPFDWHTLAGEIFGAFILMFGISAVAIGKVKAEASGLVIGGSLFVGLMIAGGISTSAVLNPAVALGLGTVTIEHILGPIVGTVLGALAYKGLKS